MMGRDELVALVRAVGECFIGLNVIEADQSLDQARRMAYWRRFSGEDVQSFGENFRPSEVARNAALILFTLSVATAEQVVFEVRYHIWSATFANIPKSTFGREFAAKMTEAEKGPPKLTLVEGGCLH